MDAYLEKLDELISEVKLLREQTKPTSEVMSVSQMAKYLSISEYTLREWVRMKRIPHHKVNKQIRFKKSKIDRWLDRNEIATSV
jgi:excisionase family DNA binding protein